MSIAEINGCHKFLTPCLKQTTKNTGTFLLFFWRNVFNYFYWLLLTAITTRYCRRCGLRLVYILVTKAIFLSSSSRRRSTKKITKTIIRLTRILYWRNYQTFFFFKVYSNIKNADLLKNYLIPEFCNYAKNTVKGLVFVIFGRVKGIFIYFWVQNMNVYSRVLIKKLMINSTLILQV